MKRQRLTSQPDSSRPGLGEDRKVRFEVWPSPPGSRNPGALRSPQRASKKAVPSTRRVPKAKGRRRELFERRTARELTLHPQSIAGRSVREALKNGGSSIHGALA
jgi:hypothetical protein